MKKTTTNSAIIICAVISLIMSGCMKEKYQFKVNDNTARLITEFTKGSVPLSRISLDDAPEPVEIELAEVRAEPRAIFSGSYKVTLVADPALIDKYNSTLKPDQVPFIAAPADAVELLNSEGNISTTAKSFIVKARIKTGVLAGGNYAFGVKIQQVTNGEISGNTGTYLVAIAIKNKLDGDYNWDFTRWNNQTGIGTPTSASFTDEVATMATLSATSVEVGSGYFFGPRYIIEFKNIGGVLSDFTAKINSDDVATLLDNGVELVDGPNVLIANPDERRYKIQYTVFNGASYRYLIDEYYK